MLEPCRARIPKAGPALTWKTFLNVWKNHWFTKEWKYASVSTALKQKARKTWDKHKDKVRKSSSKEIIRVTVYFVIKYGYVRRQILKVINNPSLIHEEHEPKLFEHIAMHVDCLKLEKLCSCRRRLSSRDLGSQTSPSQEGGGLWTQGTTTSPPTLLSSSALILLQLPSRTELEREENGSWEWRRGRRDGAELSSTYLLLKS